MAQKLKGSGVQPPTINLYALFGKFRVANSPYTIHYASTYATSNEPGHGDLLEQLTPVRESLTPDDLRDLTSLLQRDLNDRRVATELIPYLRGQRARIGFFPAVLAVLAPPGFFISEERVPYPKPTLEEQGRIDFNGCWMVERYQLDEAADFLPLGRLIIDPRKTKVVVLDGQHRATAFRYLSGIWNPREQIYEPFYDDAGGAQSLLADLPVTVIWFEADDEAPIEPRLISRQLFVDVNNTAKPVSQARTILLDDRTVTAVATQRVYNVAAREAFSADKFSLLFNAFDMDSDLARANLSKFTLTTPEIVYEALHWALFANENWQQLSQWRIQRRRPQTNTDRLLSLVPNAVEGLERGPDEDDNQRYYFTDRNVAQAFAQAFDQTYVPAFTLLFNALHFLRPHYQAATRIAEWIRDESSIPLPAVWNKVFTGGEGLYWNFQAHRRLRRGEYQEGIEKIEERFSVERASIFRSDPVECDRFYRSFATKAFQAGMIMAVDYLMDKGEGEGVFSQAAEALVERLNEYDLDQWKSILAELRPLLVSGGTDPKVWPAYRNLFIRLHEGSHFRYIEPTRLGELPEWQALHSKLIDLADALSTTRDDIPDPNALERYVSEAIPGVEQVFERCGLKSAVLRDPSVLRKGVDTLVQKLEKAFPEETYE